MTLLKPASCMNTDIPIFKNKLQNDFINSAFERTRGRWGGDETESGFRVLSQTVRVRELLLFKLRLETESNL